MLPIAWETFGFAVKAVVFAVLVVLTFAALLAIARRGRRRHQRGRLEVAPLNRGYEALGDSLRLGVWPRKALRAAIKQRKRQEGARPQRSTVYVLDFRGDLFATAVRSLRTEVTALISAAQPGDEVVLRLESPGGAVPHYGLAASQLARLKEKKLKVTVCIDRIAASGGYLMACVADTVVAAPFAIIGSIGVIAQVPNLHAFLRKRDIDFQEMTAGEFKRTVSVFGEITDKGRQKFQEQLEETHRLFKDFVKLHRPALEVDRVATGEYWLGTRALELGLVDRLATSDDYLLARAAEANLFRVRFDVADDWKTWVGRTVSEAADRSLVRVLERLLSFELR